MLQFVVNSELEKDVADGYEIKTWPNFGWTKNMGDVDKQRLWFSAALLSDRLLLRMPPPKTPGSEDQFCEVVGFGKGKPSNLMEPFMKALNDHFDPLRPNVLIKVIATNFKESTISVPFGTTELTSAQKHFPIPKVPIQVNKRIKRVKTVFAEQLLKMDAEFKHPYLTYYSPPAAFGFALVTTDVQYDKMIKKLTFHLYLGGAIGTTTLAEITGDYDNGSENIMSFTFYSTQPTREFFTQIIHIALSHVSRFSFNFHSDLHEIRIIKPPQSYSQKSYIPLHGEQDLFCRSSR
jgi:hypothetical protein